MKKLLLIAAFLLPMIAWALPFQTTPSPYDLPIHWYQLKCNGKYFYYEFGPWSDFQPSSTPSTDDAYLWCFVTTSSGKTLIYNKKSRQYLSDGVFFTSNENDANINYVEEGSGQNFYICFVQNNTKFYLDYDSEEEGSFGQLTRQHPFTATEALVEEQTEPTGQLVIGEAEVYEEHCQLLIYYTGQEPCTIDVTIDGQEASPSCSFSREEEDYTVFISATATFQNSNLNPLHTEKDVLIPGLHHIVPSDGLTFTPYDTHIPHNNADPELEGYKKLFDKNKSTKWCVVNSSGAWEPIWVDFKSNVPFVPTSYTMTTGNDTRSFKGRNPKVWKILGKATENDEWTTLVDVTDGDAEGLGLENTTDYPFAISGLTKKYQYFRFQVDEIRGKDGYNANNWVFQLAELQLDGNIDSPDIPTVFGDLNDDGIVDVTDVSIIIDMVLGKTEKDLEKADLTSDGDIDVSDVSLLIDIVLGKYDPDAAPSDQTFTVNGVSFKMIGVKGGTFRMGANDDDDRAQSNELPAHQVTLSSFSIGETEVTQELWLAVTGRNPSSYSSRLGYTENLQRPVESVSWEACQNFINTLNELTGKTFRMLTEAEWEYAARGGVKSQGYLYSGSNEIGDVAWYSGNLPSTEVGSDGRAPQSVATKAPNELGIYDMTGNVGEYCQDWYGDYSVADQTNPTGPESGNGHVVRGGGWSRPYSQCRNSARESFQPGGGSGYIGLRLAM